MTQNKKKNHSILQPTSYKRAEHSSKKYFGQEYKGLPRESSNTACLVTSPSLPAPHSYTPSPSHLPFLPQPHPTSCYLALSSPYLFPLPVPKQSTKNTTPAASCAPLCSHTAAVELCSFPDHPLPFFPTWETTGAWNMCWCLQCIRATPHCNRLLLQPPGNLKQGAEQQEFPPPLLTQLLETWTSSISFPCHKNHLSSSSLFFHPHLSTSASAEG